MITKVSKITTKPAYNILECDGSNLQARIAASLSGDPTLCTLFLNNGDFHTTNAYNIMAKYATYVPYKVTYSDLESEEIMEWESFDTETEKHVMVKDLKAGDYISSKEKEVKEVSALRGVKISFETYSSNCKKGVLKDLRTTAKLIGFGFIFGSAATTFANGTLRVEWSVPKCNEFIGSMGLESLRTQLKLKYKHFSESELAYLTVATFFRTEFFKLYPVLEKWIKEQGVIASEQGFVKSPFGARRLLPQLTYQGKHSDGKEVKNLSNIAVNSPVQNYEAVYMARAMIGTYKEMEELGFHSYIAGTVHDSIVPFAFVEEQQEILKIMLKYFAVNYPEAKGIPYSGECNEAKVDKGEVWGYGNKEWVLEEVESVELKKRNYFSPL